MHCRRTVLLAGLTALVLLVSAVMPGTAYADDPLPPTDPIETEQVPPSEAAVTPAPPGEATAPTEATSPAEDMVTGELPAPTEEATLPEVLGALPEGTEVVVLDTGGEPLAMATNEAADVLVNGDPMWCPEGTAPGGAGCTNNHSTFSDLVTELYGGGVSGNGTIYVAYDYSVGGADAAGIWIDQDDTQLGNLVIQGGWDFGSSGIIGTSTIATDMTLLNWGSLGGGTLVLNDLSFSGGGGLHIYDGNGITTADVTLNNVSVAGSDSYGAEIETTGDITVNDSEFTANDYDGLYGWSGDDFSIDNSSFNGNRNGGITVGAGGDLSLVDVVANQNGSIGILAGAMGNTTLARVSANANEYAGVVVGAMGNTTLSDVTADENGYVGAAAGSVGNLNLVRINTDTNEGVGLIALALGDATLSEIDANQNPFVGVVTLSLGETSLSNVTANENGVGVVAVSLGGLPILDLLEMGIGYFTGGQGYPGEIVLPDEVMAQLEAAEETPGNTMLSNVIADGNEWAGVVAGAFGSTSLSDVYADDNGYVGGVAISGSNVFVGDSTFNSNGYLGLGALSLLDGNVEVLRILAMDNDGVGVAIGSLTLDPFNYPYIEPSTTGSATLTCSIVTGNSDYGLLGLSNIVIAGNDLSGNGLGEYVELLGTVSEGTAGDCSNLAALSDYMAKRRASISGPGCPDLTLREGDVTAVLHNLCGHEVSLDLPELPGALPSNSTLASHVTVVSEDLPVADGFITLAFPVPAGADTATLAVLTWDGSQWVPVSGGSIVGGMFIVDVKDAGTHVLVQQ